MDGIHDMGGMDGFGPMVPDDANFHADWERRVYGLARVTRVAGIGSGMFRAAIESMPPAEYLAASYYERWMYGVERRLERDGTLTPAEIEDGMARFATGAAARAERSRAGRALRRRRSASGAPMEAAAAPRFRPGQRVRVHSHAARRATRAARATCAARSA